MEKVIGFSFLVIPDVAYDDIFVVIVDGEMKRFWSGMLLNHQTFQLCKGFQPGLVADVFVM